LPGKSGGIYTDINEVPETDFLGYFPHERAGYGACIIFLDSQIAEQDIIEAIAEVSSHLTKGAPLLLLEDSTPNPETLSPQAKKARVNLLKRIPTKSSLNKIGVVTKRNFLL